MPRVQRLDDSPHSRVLADAVRRALSPDAPIDVEIETCFAGPRHPDEPTVYDVAASHRYPVTPASLETGDAVFEIDGWVESRPRAVRPRLLNDRFRASIRSAFSVTTGSLEPLAVVPFGPSSYWVVADHLEDGIEYGIYEVTSTHAQRVSILPLAR